MADNLRVLKRCQKKIGRITFRMTADQKRHLRVIALAHRKLCGAFVRDLVLAEIGKWSTVVATEEPEKKAWQGRPDVALGR